MPERPLGDRVIGWYGEVAQKNMVRHPLLVRRWLMAGFELMRLKTRYVDDRTLFPSGNEGYRLFMDSVVGALADMPRCVVTSVFTPNEAFHAMGLKPVTAEAVASFASGAQAESGFAEVAEGRGIPETYCSYHRILMGMALSGVLEPARLLVSTSVACDANNLTFKTLASLWDARHVYVDVPYEVTRDSMLYVADQLREMTSVAQDVYHARLDEELLLDLCRRSERTDRELRATLPARRGRYLAGTMTTDLMQMLDFHLSLGLPRAEELARQLALDLYAAPPFGGLRIVWAHVSPFFLGSIGQMINVTQDAQVVASDMLFDHLPPDEGYTFSPESPFEFMAERVVRNCFNGPATRRTSCVRRLAEATDADGVVIFCHWGCKQTAGASQLMRRELERAGYPTLVLDGDAVERANCAEGQMDTRFSAFLEMLRRNRRRATAPADAADTTAERTETDER